MRFIQVTYIVSLVLSFQSFTSAIHLSHHNLKRRGAFEGPFASNAERLARGNIN
jgi:hypothetical protein